MARRFMVEDRGQVSFVHRLAASLTGVEMSALQGRLAAQALTDMTKSGIEHGSLLLLGDSTLGEAIWFRAWSLRRVARRGTVSMDLKQGAP